MKKFSNMNVIKSLTVLIIATTICFAQSINISGTVKNSSGNGIAGAEVKLEKANKKTTTDSNGKFSFGKTGVISNNNGLKIDKFAVNFRDKVWFLDVYEKGPVEITAYTLNGKAISKVNMIMEKGTHNVTASVKGVGLYIYSIKTAQSEMIIKNISIGGISVSSSINLSRNVKTASTANFNDILAVTKNEYLDYKIIVKNPDTSGMDVKMIDCAGTVKDMDGNEYQSVKIGNQIWMTGSLKTTKFNDGTQIPNVSENNKWKGLSTAAYCYNYNKTENGKNGLLYNWYAASHPKIAPKGWRVPTHAEQEALQTYLQENGFNYDGTKNTKGNSNKVAKSMAAKYGWAYKKTNETNQPVSDTIGMICNDLHTNNSTGFSALPVGSRWCDASFHSLEHSLYMWSCTPYDKNKTDGWHTSVHTWLAAYGYNHHDKRTGFAIRLIKE